LIIYDIIIENEREYEEIIIEKKNLKKEKLRKN
jgi:hypothetical protein